MPMASAGLVVRAMQQVRPAALARRLRARVPEMLGLGVVLAVAAAVRVVALGRVPRIVTADETDNLQTAYHIIEGTGPGFFGFDWKPAPIFSLYPLAWTIQLFGDSVSDFRMFPVIMSLLTIALMYRLARESIGAPAALAAALLLATNSWFVHFSRTAWENVNSALFAVGACWSMVRALKTGRWRWWIATGAFVAMGLYGYFTARFIFVSVALVAVIAVAVRDAPWRRTAAGLTLAGIVAAVLFAPMAKNIVAHWDHFNSRTNNVSVFNTKEPYEGETDGWVIAAKNLKINYQAFILQDGTQTRRGLWSRYNPSGRAPLDFAAAHLFWAGLVVAAFRWRTTYVWWPFFVPLFIAEVFSRGSPDLARGVIIAPFYFLFIGLVFDEILRRGRRVVVRLAAMAAILALVGFIGVTNVRGYFSWQGQDETQLARLPGADRCEFPMWRQLAVDAARRGTNLLDPKEFDRRRRELNCSPIVRTALRLPAPPRPTPAADSE